MQGILPQANEIQIVAKGNCGTPAYIDGTIHYQRTAELLADHALFAPDAGAKIICRCCGTRPVHVAAMVSALNGMVKRPFDRAAIAGYADG